MGNTTKTQEFADQAQQNLPPRGKAAGPASQSGQASSLTPDRPSSNGKNAAAVSNPLAALVPDGPAQIHEPSNAGIPAESIAAARSMMGRLVDGLSQQVIQFKQFSAGSMAVMLRPDSHTEIFLHLRLNGGTVEVQARFERGDFAALSGQWTQVQQALAGQGVRLSGLHQGPVLQYGSFGSSGHGQHPGFHQQSSFHQPPSVPEEEEPSFSNTSLGRAAAVRKPQRSTSPLGWEGWA